ncbi:MAG: L-fucokinase [Cellulosilyticaceae bacterium]
MNNHIKNTYLKQSYIDGWETYKTSLESNKEVAKWDFFIITATSNSQARAYRMQIEERLDKGYLSRDTQYIVVADPLGKRVGSGGATLNALYEVTKQYGLTGENPFKEKKILLIHSGGDSKRIPQYSAFGKLFSRVPRELPDGRYATLFDEFVIALSGVPSRMSEGILIASGDVLLICNTNQMDFTRKGVVGIAIQEEGDVGTRHGVYQMDKEGRVKKFLHKLPLDKLEEAGAVGPTGLVNIDTGLIWLEAEVASKLLGLIMTNQKLDRAKYETFINEKLRLNFYGDFLIPFTKESTLEDYLMEASEGEYSQELLEVRRQIWETFCEVPMHVQSLSPARFVHFGTSQELRELMSTIHSVYHFMDWSEKVISVDDRLGERDEISLVNSYIGEHTQVGEGSFIEDSQLEGEVVIGKGCILSNVIAAIPVTLGDHLVLHTLPVEEGKGNTGYITRVYGVLDDPKREVNEGTFLNRPLRELSSYLEEPIENLWEVPLYPMMSSIEESLESALWLSRIHLAREEEIKKWLSLKRYSLKTSYEIADLKCILKTQEATEDRIRTREFMSQAVAKEWVETIYPLLGKDKKGIARRLPLALAYCEQEAVGLSQLRLYRYVAEVQKKIGLNFREIENKAYETLALMIEKSTLGQLPRDWNGQIKKDGLQSVKVYSPARINFGGGWSDTPPYSIENGGTVLNAAIKLNGALPIQVEAKKLKESVIRLVSYDLGMQKTYHNLKEMGQYCDPTDPFALHKAALVVVGILPLQGKEGALDKVLNKVGCGIELRTRVDIPKGSGLGSSSILAGTVIKALKALFDIPYENNQLFDEVLCTEQLMTTGGGWQDQVGGLIPGIKLVRSQKGLLQLLEVTSLELSDTMRQALNKRLVLVYTGQRRLAKGILREIMGEYILSHPDKIEILNEIQKLAIMMKYELEKENINHFCQLLNTHLELIRKLDAGSTNSYIDAIIEVCKPYAEGLMICGAGGGGFLQIILREGVSRAKLKEVLEQVFGDNHVEVWDAEIY